MNAPPNAPLTQAFRVVAITYEKLPDGSSWVPVVRHEFYGPSPERAVGVYHAHLESDAFLRGCQTGHYQGIECRTMVYQVERMMA